MDRLTRGDRELQRLFDGKTVFSCAALNFGPHAVTKPHKDCTNCPFGWCSIQAFGDFNSARGGQIVLWEPKLIIEFPSGSTILIPSALVTHSNIPVDSHETRHSFTMFTPGNIFRYVENGFRTDADLKATEPNLYEQLRQARGSRWEEGVGRFSTLLELITRVRERQTQEANSKKGLGKKGDKTRGTA
jgi:hypothetical protein